MSNTSPPSRRRVALLRVLAVGLVAAFSAFLGASYGYLYGGPQHKFRFADGDAVTTVVQLRALRRGDVQYVVDSLERALDIHIIEHASFDRDMDRLLGWWSHWMWPTPDPEDMRNLVEYVAKYRREFPRRYEDPDLKAKVERHLDASRKTPSNSRPEEVSQESGD